MEAFKRIYIGYCDADNIHEEPQKRAWVEEFEHLLEKRLSQLFTQELRFFRNPDCGNPITEADPSTLYLNILSNNFLEQPACREYLESLYAEGETNPSQVFNVHLEPLKDQLLEGLNGAGYGYDFYKENPLDWELIRYSFANGHSLEYFLALENLAFDLYARQKSPSDPAHALPKAPAAPERSPAVFLAFSGRDTRNQRIRIKWELERFGFRVLPYDNWRPKDRNFKAEAMEMLAQCSLSVHLVGEDFGLRHNYRRQDTIPEQHNAYAAEFCRDHRFSRLVWIPPEINVGDENQHQNLLRFRDDAEAIRGAEIFQIPLEEFKQVILSKIRKIGVEIQVKDKDTAEVHERAEIYLIYEPWKQDLADKVIPVLEAKGCKVRTLASSGNSVSVRKAHKAHLLNCDAALVLYQDGNPIWLQTKINELRKATGMGRSAPIPLKGLLLMDAVGMKLEELEEEFVVLTGNTKFEAGSLENFLLELEKIEVGLEAPQGSYPAV